MTATTGTGEMVSVVESIPEIQGEVTMKPVDPVEELADVVEPANVVVVEDMEPLALSSVEAPVNGSRHFESMNPDGMSGSSDFESMNPDDMNLLSGKPRRPLSAYNIFFQHEREKIVSNAPDIPVTLEALKIDPRRRPKKRRHRKSHGKIGFADLARQIAEKWKAIDSESRSVFVACAAKEKERYQEQITLWREAKKKEDIGKQAAAKNHAADMMLSNNAVRDFMMNGLNRAGENRLDMGSIHHEGLSSHMMTGMHNVQPSMGVASDCLEYLQITQQVIDMARASLTLPLFANIGSNLTMNGLSNGQSSMMNDLLNGQSSTMNGLGLSSMMNGLSNGQSSNLANLKAALRMNENLSSNMFQSSNHTEPLQLSNTPLLNVPLGSNRVSNYESEAASLYRMMQVALPNQMFHRSLDTTLQDYQNQLELQRELDSNQALLNQAMQSHHAEFDSGHNDYLGFSDFGSTLTGQNYQDPGLNGLKMQANDAHGDELLSMINASLREQF